MKMTLLLIVGLLVSSLVPAPMDFQCITDMECELLYGGEE